MHSFFTRQVESYVGSVYIVLLAAFFIGLFFIAVKNFETDADILSNSSVQVKGISQTERLLMKSWVEQNDILIPEGEGYRYLKKKYPLKPWLQ